MKGSFIATLIKEGEQWRGVGKKSKGESKELECGQYIICFIIPEYGFPDSAVVKNPPANAGNMDLILGWGRCPGGGHGNPLQYFCLENPMDRGAWRATVSGVTK